MSQATEINALFSALWQDYVKITPSADKIHALLKTYDGTSDIVNDHIALRTLALPGLRINDLAQHFIALGYEHGGDYDFSGKKLNAMHFEHPNTDHPKVFISELKVDELSEQSQSILKNIAQQCPDGLMSSASGLYSGSHWDISSDEYAQLLEESEYAAWFAAWGYRVNHFTVSVNHLSKYRELIEINALLKDNLYTLNSAGGEIKGSAEVCLAQSSTMADKMPVVFNDKTMLIPSCFYEFAQRFPLANGKLYQGFVAASADKIFESTNVNG